MIGMPDHTNVRMKSYFGRFIPLLFIVALAFIIGNAFILFTSVQELIANERLETHTHQVITEIDSISSSLIQAESVQRSFIISSDPRYLLKFQSGLTAITDHVNRLKRLTAGNSSQQKQIQEITATTNERIYLLKEGITRLQNEGFDSAQAFVTQGKGIGKMQEIQSITSSMKQKEQQVLTQPASQSQVSVDELYSAISISLLIGVVFVILLFSFIKREFDQRTLSEQRKNDFISIASHELKTPITSMSVFTELLKKRTVSMKDKQITHYIEKIQEQIAKQTSLINDLLDISKMQAGKIDLQKAPFDMNSIVRETVETVQTTTKTHKLIIRGHAKSKVFGDKQRIGQVLINFISNAIKYSPQADKVIITIRQQRQYVTVTVQDFGIGIARRHHKKIFTRFYRAREGDRSFPGLGIGLYITFEIIRRHEGKVWVESAEGKGAKFVFTLPIATYI